MLHLLHMQNAGQHHLHVRKRLYKGLEPIPHPEGFKRFLDHIMVFIALTGPVATLPQIFDVMYTHNVGGLSPTTWSLWMLLSGIWVVYGWLHKEVPLIASNTLYIVLQGYVVWAIFEYGNGLAF